MESALEGGVKQKKKKKTALRNTREKEKLPMSA
jgi:hypothetical protein